MTQNRTRQMLYRKYIKELSRYDHDLKYCPSTEVKDWAKDYYEDKKTTTWIDLMQDGSTVGFVIITHHGGDCHPDCDHYIAQTFVLTEHRHRGLATNAVRAYIREHPGKYGYDVIIGNEYAKQFWHKLFLEINAKPIQLCRTRDERTESKLEVFGYMV